MKQNYKNKSCSVLLIITLMSMIISSCKKFVTLPLPNTQIPANAIFNDVTGLNAALNGAYSDAGYSAQDVFTKASLFADELISNNSGDQISQKNQYTPNDDYYYFNSFYATIIWTNTILSGVDNATNLPVATRNQVKGECLFLRAFSYFQLVSLYGGVPLYTGIDLKTNSLLPGSPPADIYKQIIADLTVAGSLLSDDYPEGTRTRANKETVNALLARTYLYTKDFPNAITASTAVINSSLYNLNPDLNAIFQSTSTETIWQLYNQSGVALGGTYIPYNPQYPTYIVRSGLLTSFEPGDGRKDAWLMADTGNVPVNYYPYKWKGNFIVPAAEPEYLIEFRLAEMYLIRAESYAQTNNVADGLKDINSIRNRAGLTASIPVTTPAELLDTVASERRKELCFEGQRWFDLVRTGQAVNVLSPLKPGFDTHLEVLPIPVNSVLKFNPNIKQNPGYN